LGGAVVCLRVYGLETDRPLIAFAVLDKPVRWGRGHAQIVILAACPRQFEKENEMFYFFVRELMNNRHYVRALVKSCSYDTLLDLYEEVIRKRSRAL
jgi:mannitol/fructose-specific phosphotransferase system IIA component (Ntr-type)